MAARKPSRSDLDATRVLLTQLGLEHVSEQLPELLEHGVRQELTLLQPLAVHRDRRLFLFDDPSSQYILSSWRARRNLISKKFL